MCKPSWKLILFDPLLHYSFTQCLCSNKSSNTWKCLLSFLSSTWIRHQFSNRSGAVTCFVSCVSQGHIRRILKMLLKSNRLWVVFIILNLNANQTLKAFTHSSHISIYRWLFFKLAISVVLPSHLYPQLLDTFYYWYFMHSPTLSQKHNQTDEWGKSLLNCCARKMSRVQEYIHF